MLNFPEISHVAVVVTSLETSLVELGEQFGLTFAEIRTVDLPLRTETTDRRVRLRVTYSQQGPPFLEVIEALEGTPWTQVQGASSIHHVGGYVDDVDAEAKRLVDSGLPIEFTGMPHYVYLRGPMGLRFELLPSASRVRHMAWIRGEQFDELE